MIAVLNGGRCRLFGLVQAGLNAVARWLGASWLIDRYRPLIRGVKRASERERLPVMTELK